jgi:ribonuclease HI
MTLELYTDGGVIGKNPSPLGGTWCFCVVQEGEILWQGSDIITPDIFKIKTISNNFSELYAAVMGLSSLPIGWEGTLYSDSLITIHRVTNSVKFNGIPNSLRLKTLDLRRNRKYKTVLLGGHPNKLELDSGFRKDGKPVSKWNVLCDKTCTKLAKGFPK